MSATEIYVKNKQAIAVDLTNLFVYEVSVYARNKNYFSLIKKHYYSAPYEIPGTVSSFYKNPYTEICCDLYAAPLQWLLDNDFVKYQKPDKKLTKIKQ